MERKIRINTEKVHVRMGPAKEYPVNGDVYRNDIFTIVEEKNGYGLLKSMAGWIELKWCEKVS